MQSKELQSNLNDFISASYPDMKIIIEPWEEDTSKTAIYFIDDMFSYLYPMQRFHYINHLIPLEFQNQHMQNTVWFELVPDEDPRSLEYPDEELVSDITPDVMNILKKVGFFEELDNLLCPEHEETEKKLCHGDFRHSKSILPNKGFVEAEYFDVFHVLMAQGGNCDCEILYNVSEANRMKSKYWKNRANGNTESANHHKA